MRNNRRKINQSIMYGVIGMAIAVMLVVFMFMYFFMDSQVPVTNE